MTHRKDEDGVEARARGRVEAEHGGRERDLLRLAEDVEPDAHDHDDGDVEPDRGGLDRERDQEHADREERRGPGHEPVDGSPDDGRHRDADDAYDAEDADHDAG